MSMGFLRILANNVVMVVEEVEGKFVPGSFAHL